MNTAQRARARAKKKRLTKVQYYANNSTAKKKKKREKEEKNWYFICAILTHSHFASFAISATLCGHFDNGHRDLDK